MSLSDIFDLRRLERAKVDKEALMLAFSVSQHISITVAADEEARILEQERVMEKRKRRRHRSWIRPWIRRHSTHGGEVLLQELATEDPRSYMNVLRMNTTFDELLSLVHSKIQKQDTPMRCALPARLKLEVTLRFLASGDSFKSLSYFFRLPPSSISKFLPEVLHAIRIALASFLQVNYDDF